MATQTERRVVYAAGMVQGIALVTFPAASTILTDPAEYDLSSTQYGTLFLPQVITAITAALLSSSLGGRIGTKRVYLVGLAASLGAMALLLVSSFLTGDETLAYALLLLATACLGAGFGFASCSQHVHRRLQPWRRRPLDPRSECAPRAGHRARGRVRGDLRRPRILVGAAARRRCSWCCSSS